MSTSVIVIDDDHDTVEVFAEYLEIKGINVLGKGYDGREAFQLYKNLKPEVILLDIMMPDYDGFFALEKIREFDPNAKVVVLTADLSKETEDRLKDLKVNAIKYKPYDIEEMSQTVEQVNRGEVVVLYQ